MTARGKHSAMFHAAQIQSCSVHVHCTLGAKDLRYHVAYTGLGGNDRTEVRENLDKK